MSLPRSHHHPAHLSPQVSSVTQAGGSSAHLQAGFPCPTSPSLHSIAPVALPIVLAGAFLFLIPTQGLSTSLQYPPTQATKPTGLAPVCPCSCWALSPPADCLAFLVHFTLCLSSAVTTGFLGDYQNPAKEGQSCPGWTERPPVSHVSLGTSANVSSPEASASAPLVTHPPTSRH